MKKTSKALLSLAAMSTTMLTVSVAHAGGHDESKHKEHAVKEVDHSKADEHSHGATHAKKSESASTLQEALTGGDIDIAWRYRLGYIDVDGFADTSKASTLRTLIGYRTKPFHGVSAYAQFRDVSVIGNDLYNDTLNGETTRPVEADPESDEIHQAYLQYDGIKDTKVILGRRHFKYGNQRFIGTLAWRQNDRTFDGAFVETKALHPDTEFKYAYVTNVNRGFSDDSPIGNFDANTNLNLFNFTWSGAPYGKLETYTYLADLEGFNGAENLSSATYGASYEGKVTLSEKVKLLYRAEYAFQTDYGDNPNSFDLNYFHINPGVEYGPVTAKLGYEFLESDGQNTIRAPLGLLHAFGGWADVFLPAPPTGLKDAYIDTRYTIKHTDTVFDGTKFILAYHDFQAQSGGADYGTEWDFAVIKKIAKYYTVSVKYANYDADEFASDTEKVWLTLGAKF